MRLCRTKLGKGVECSVYPTDDPNVVYKLYNLATAREDAQFAYNEAVKAANLGLGPKVYRRGFHGYFTQRVELIEYKDIEENPVLAQRMGFLVDELREYHLSWQDIHCGNVGFIENELVRIDFGPASS